MSHSIQRLAGVTAASLLIGAAPVVANVQQQQEQPADQIAALDALEASLKKDNAGSLATPGAVDNATINLLRLMVKRGLVSHEDAVELIRQAEQEAVYTRAQSEAVMTAAEQIKAAAQSEIEHNEADIRITYIPETVKEEIAADVSHNVMDQARRENWAMTPSGPKWLERLSIFADMRVRYEVINFPSGNGEPLDFIDFNAINSGSPFNWAGTPKMYPPLLNASENRQRSRLRARFGFEAQLEDGLSMGVRLATGTGSSPVSTNQTMGSPGSFRAYSIWLDRAYLRWDQSWDDLDVGITFGRFANPFFSTEIIWDDDIGFDGMAVQLKHRFTNETSAFLTAGAFPVFNTSLNFGMGQSTLNTAKFKSENRYLFAVQGGVEHQIDKDINVKLAVGYYHFENVHGRRSTPFIPVSANDRGDTDDLRPTFAQKGNTYMTLRDIPEYYQNGDPNYNQWQYYGLASKFQVISATSRVDFNHFEPFQISLYAEFIKNLGLSKSRMQEYAFNNLDAITDNTGALIGTQYNGGDTAWIVGVSAGDVVLDERWNWRVGVDYRYMESDSFIDGFVGSDFGLGGTNLKGITIGGQVAILPSLTLGMRWMSASEVSGPRYRTDIFQFDLSTQF